MRSSVHNQIMNISLKDEHMKSIRRTKRSLEDYLKKGQPAVNVLRRMMSHKSWRVTSRLCEGPQTHKLTIDLDDPSYLRKSRGT